MLRRLEEIARACIAGGQSQTQRRHAQAGQRAGSENENEDGGDAERDLVRVGDEHAMGPSFVFANAGGGPSCSPSEDDEYEDVEDAVERAGEVGRVGTECERA